MKGFWLLSLLAVTGCVQRSIVIESVPPGAAVTLDGKSVGRTPIEVPFTWYGDREIVLELTGYESKIVLQPVSAPWWQYFPFDFITEVLLPIPMEDRRVFRFRLKPFPEDDFDDVRKRAEEAKKKAGKD